MKHLFKTALFAASLFAASHAYAQTQDTTVGQKVGTTAKKVGKATATAAKDVGHTTATAAKDVGHATATTAKKVGHKTSEIASKGASAIVDKKYEGKVGPGGQTIYIDKNSAYYYVDTKGHRIYVPKAELVDKPVE